MDRIQELEGEVRQLRELLRSLTLSVQFDDREPYEAYLAEREIAGDQKLALQLVIASVLSRAMGDVPQKVRDESLLRAYPVIAEAQQDGNISLAEGIRMIGQIVGTQAEAIKCLEAHRDRGLFLEGHEALGI